MNSAFVFIKPHANTAETRRVVHEALQAKGIAIVREGELTGEEIDRDKLIDQHYYAIASKATLLTPDQLNVPEAKFEAKFGLAWKSALSEKRALNAMQACAELQVDALQLDEMWAAAKKADKLLKAGGGFYIGELPRAGKSPIFVLNGFFMSMRQKFVVKGSSIHYYVVEWDAAKLSWKDFRGKVLGPTDPADAPAGALRQTILAQWQQLGLAAAPNVGDNGVHASASPFEALAERLNWLHGKLEEDSFGKRLLAAGVTKEQILAWSIDPQVIDGDGKQVSRFDSLEDADSDECIALCVTTTDVLK